MSYIMDVEPLVLKNHFPPLPTAGKIPRLEPTGGGKKPLHDKEGRRRIALEPGKAQEVAARHGFSVSYVFVCRREFEAERDAAGLSGNKAAYDAADRLRIALTDGPSQRAIAKQFDISPATLWAYRREFRRERIAAGLEKESTGATERAASSAPEVVAGGTPVDEPPAGVETGRGNEIEDWLL